MDLYVPGKSHEDLGSNRVVKYGDHVARQALGLNTMLMPEKFPDPRSRVVVPEDESDTKYEITIKNYKFDPPSSSVSPWHQKKWDELQVLRSQSLQNFNGTSQEKLDLIVERVRAGDYKLYTRLIRPNFTFAPLHEVFSNLMECLLFKFITHGMLSCGPRLGKSSLMCLLITYFFGLSEGRANSLCTTYGADLTIDFGGEILATISDNIFKNLFPKSGLSKDSKAKKRFQFENGGKFFASSVGGALVGKGAGTMQMEEFGGIKVIDDPVKDMSEALSSAKMNALHSWFDNEFNTRGNANHVSLITGTRYGVNDLHAHCLKTTESGEEPNLYDKETNPTGQWVYLNIKTLCLNSESDPLNRKVGESAWEKMYTSASLYEKMEDPDQFSTFWALFQGTPQSKKGGLFKPWYFLPLEEAQNTKIDFTFVSLDPSFGVDQNESCFTIFGVTTDRKKAIVMEQESSGQWQFPELLNRAKKYFKQWNCTILVIESTATGKPLYQKLLQEAPEITCVLVNVAGKNKQERLIFNLPSFKWDKSDISNPKPPRIYFLMGIYTTRLKFQLFNFPFAGKDDLVDSLNIGVTYFNEFIFEKFEMSGNMPDIESMFENYKNTELENIKMSTLNQELMLFGLIDNNNDDAIDELVLNTIGENKYEDSEEFGGSSEFGNNFGWGLTDFH
jgi:hypothetical protein